VAAVRSPVVLRDAAIREAAVVDLTESLRKVYRCPRGLSTLNPASGRSAPDPKSALARAITVG